MTIKQALLWANQKLKHLARAGHYDTPTLDAEILLSFALKKPKEFLYAHSEKKLTRTQFGLFKKLIARRAKHEPVAYITGLKEFFGLDFYVSRNVMIPRPETEILVEETIKKIKDQKSKIKNLIVDVGTGSGCIIISLAKKIPNYLITKLPIQFFATEISPSALKVAQKNARRHKAAITFLHGNLLEPIIKKIKNQELKIKVLHVTANLPYLTTNQWRRTQPEIKKYEPRLALDGGPDGLKYHRQLLQQIKLLIANYQLPITLFFEIDPSQVKRITKLIYRYFPAAKIEIKKDLAGRDRVVIVKLLNV